MINCTDIHFKESSFRKNVGRGLSLHAINGHMKIERVNFLKTVPFEEQMYLFGGGGIHIEFRYCTPGNKEYRKSLQQ